MFIKFVLLGSVVAASFLVASSAEAQIIGCPEGYYMIGGGNAGWVGCAPYDTRSQYPTLPEPEPEPEPSPPIPTKYANSYIAIAWHPEAADVWATWNHRTIEKSQEVALNACTQVMGAGCTIAVNGWNGSVAIAQDKNNLIWYGWGSKPDNARKNVLKACKDKNEGCKIAHVFTAEPLIQPANFTPLQQQILETNPAFDFSKNYFPDRSVPRIKPVVTAKPEEPKRGFLAIAWLGNTKAAWNNFVISANHATADQAKAAAIARCEMESKTKCVSFGDIDDLSYPLFGLYRTSSDGIFWYNNSTAAQIEKMAANHCREQGVTCQKIGIFDARKPGTSVYSIGN